MVARSHSWQPNYFASWGMIQLDILVCWWSSWEANKGQNDFSGQTIDQDGPCGSTEGWPMPFNHQMATSRIRIMQKLTQLALAMCHLGHF